MRGFGLMVLGVALTLAGCGERAIFGEQPARTAAECRAQFEEASSRGNQAYLGTPTTGAGVAGASLGKGLARGLIEGAYNQCLARVAQNGGDMTEYPDPEGARARAEAELNQMYYGTTPTSGCPPRSSVMVGGKQYCVGTHQ